MKTKEETTEEGKPSVPTPPELEDKYVVGDVATETARMIHDTETKENIDIHEAIARLMNDIEIIKKGLL
jgi:hypothetical protein